MKVTLEAINTAAFAIRKRLLGYKLLRNPKGSSPYEVNMMKMNFGLHYKYYDDIFTYTRINRKKINGKTVVTKRTLFSTHFMDPSTKKITNKKDMLYLEERNGKSTLKSMEREDIPYEEQDKRPAPNWRNDEKYLYEKKRYEAESYKNFYQSPITYMEKIATFGKAKSFRKVFCNDYRPIAPGFFKVLFSNLSNNVK